MRKKGHFVRRGVILGADRKLIEEIAHECKRDHLLGMELLGVLAPPAITAEELQALNLPVPVLGEDSDLKSALDDKAIDTVIFFAADIDHSALEQLIWECENRGLEVWVKLDFIDRVIYSASIDSLKGIPFINFRGALHDPAKLFVKYSFDKVASLTLLTLLSPLLIGIALAVKCTSQGPVLFTQYRAGVNGRKFLFYKFRSMVENAEDLKSSLQDKNEVDGPAFKVSNDPRVTPFGHFLRRSSLDELPQLWNVFKGDMSLVGPRPLPIEEVKMFDRWHRRRLSIRPGITGSWQVAGRSDVADFNNWARMDLDYIDDWSLEKDFAILLRTIPAVLLGRGAR